MKINYQKKRDIKLQAAKAYREANRDVVRQRKKDYVEHNKEKVTAKKRRDYLANRDAVLAKARGCPRRAKTIRAWREKNKDYIAQYSVEYVKANAEAYKAARDEYRWTHRAERVFAERKRRQRRRAAGGSHTLSEWIARCEEYGFRCCYCEVSGERLTQDHDIPVSRGGSDDISNIVPACMRCNCRKGTRTGEEFRSWMSRPQPHASNEDNSDSAGQGRIPSEGKRLQLE